MEKVLNMENSRYPKICLLRLKDLTTRFPNNDNKYN